MNSTSNLLRRAPRTALLGCTAAVAAAALSTSVALAHGGQGHRLDRFKGEGAKAASVARHHVGSGKVTSVVENRSGRVRYEVDMRKGARHLQVDLSRRFRVLDVHREHARDDDEADHDGGDDHGMDDPADHDADDHGMDDDLDMDDPADVGDDHANHGAGHQ